MEPSRYHHFNDLLYWHGNAECLGHVQNIITLLPQRFTVVLMGIQNYAYYDIAVLSILTRMFYFQQHTT